MGYLSEIEIIITNVLNSIGRFAPFLACFLILIESILPIMPLAVFITINFYYMGTIIGFLVSWFFTCIGCFLSFKLCRTRFKKYFDKIVAQKDNEKLNRLKSKIDDLKLEQLVILLAIPFTPAFLVNIAAGLSDISQKKFIIGILIGKIFLVYFWGFIGTSLLDSIKDPMVILRIVIITIIAFCIGKIVNKKYDLE